MHVYIHIYILFLVLFDLWYPDEKGFDCDIIAPIALVKQKI